jgi:DNA mismatch repair protein MSH3
VDELDSTDVSNYASNAFPSLMCLVEQPLPRPDGRNQVTVGLLSVTPSTGDVVYDCFEDGPLRLELETRLAHLRPDEILASDQELSKESEGVLSLRAEKGYVFANSPHVATSHACR